MSELLAVLLAACGGAAVAVAAREGLAAAPTALTWLRPAFAALARSGGEGLAPSERDRRRLGVLAGAVLGLGATLVAGLGPATLIAALGPAVAERLLGLRRRRFREQLITQLPEIATAVADAIAAGGSLRNGLSTAGGTLDGPAAVELGRIRADLELGLSPAGALEAFGVRADSEEVTALVAAVLSQQRSGGDLALLLRRHAEAGRAHRRALAQARSTTAQARLTGGMVVAMPLGAAALVELAAPGFVGGMLADPIAALLLAVSVGLQLGGYLLIRRLGDG